MRIRSRGATANRDAWAGFESSHSHGLTPGHIGRLSDDDSDGRGKTSMFLRTKRILMNEVDAGSGNGAAAAAPTETPQPEPQAQGAAPQASVDIDAITASVADKVFAALRKAGAFEKPQPNKAAKPSGTQAPTQEPVLDAVKLRSLDRALSKHGMAERLSDAHYRRVEKAFAEDSPDDATAWVKDYFDGLGVAPSQTATQVQAAQPAPKPATEHPVSNRGAPPVTQVPLEEADLVSMSESDRRAFIQSKGVRAYVTQLAKQLKGRPVQLR